MKKLALLIPAFQPSRELPELVDAVLKGAPEIAFAVVVDDGSDAASCLVFDPLRAMDRVEVITHAANLGKGAALKTGFNWILVHDREIGGIVTADADGQHRSEDIARVAREHHDGRLTLGVRAFEGAVPLRSRIGNTVTRFFFHVFTGLRLSDTQTGLRVWPRALCLDVLRLAYNGYAFEFEALLGAKRGDIAEVPIRTIYSPGNVESHFNPVRDSFRIYFVFLRYSASALVAAALDSTVFSLVLARTGELATAQIAGRAVATAVAFFLLRGPVFRSANGFWLPLARFLLLVAASGYVSLILIRALTDTGVAPMAAKLIAEGTLFAANFALQRTLIFRRD
ncbi:MAG: glycosyltransferase [Acidobacteria bacterium]|nr:glycosyltransferase [Acidobacteriota bacterium]